MTYIPVALEMYSVRKDFSENPLATMKAIKAMGYEGVEFAGNPEFCPEFYAALLKETGLVCCGWHTPWEAVQEDRLEQTIKLNQAVGNRCVIVPYLAASTNAEWAAMAAKMNALADKLAAFGMRCGYHNHSHEFKAAEDGKTPWKTYMDVCSDKVIMQLDTGNALAGGADLMAVLNAHPGRSLTIHLKPYSLDPAIGDKALIGQDDCPWKDIIAFCHAKGGTEWFIIEYECPEIPAMEAVKRCLDGLKAFL